MMGIKKGLEDIAQGRTQIFFTLIISLTCQPIRRISKALTVTANPSPNFVAFT
jgi:hypothetical protein